MDAFAIPILLFGAGLAWLLVELIKGSIDDPIPRRAGIWWAVTCPVAGLLLGVGLTPLGIIVGTVSMLALGSLGYWFLSTAPLGDDGDDADDRVAPDPGPSDDVALQPFAGWPKTERRTDWAIFDRARSDWEHGQPTVPLPPAPARTPEVAPEPAPAGPAGVPARA